MKPRRLAQLRQDAAGAFGGRGVREERLAGQTRRQHVGVDLRIPFPGPHCLRARTSGRECEASIRCSRRSTPVSACRIDFIEATEIAGQRVGLAFHGMRAEIFEQIVVRVHAVQRGIGRMGLAKVTEQIVDEMR